MALFDYTKGKPYLLHTNTCKRDQWGFRTFLLQLVNQGKAVDALHCISGSPAAQRRELVHPKDDFAGSGNPIPEGIYRIADIIRMTVPEQGVGYSKIPLFILPKFDVNKRSELLIHQDFNYKTSKGTMGCIAPSNAAGMRRIEGWCEQKARPEFLVVNYGKGLLKSKGVTLDLPASPVLGRKINQAGLNLIKESEGCELTAYRCPSGVLTIGWGHTKVVHPGMRITQVEADELLSQDIAEFEQDVSDLVKVPLNDNQFSALVSFAFNCGSDIDADTIPEGLGDSTLLKLLNQGDYKGASEQFLLWTKANGKESSGLKRRREAERKLFLS